MASGLISSDRVEGTDVYGPDRKKIGSVKELIIEKTSGQVRYAVTSFGGFLGMGQDEHPLPWSTLRFDTSLDGYVTNVTEEQVKGAPEEPRSRTEPSWDDREWETRLLRHYGVDPYWP